MRLIYLIFFIGLSLKAATVAVGYKGTSDFKIVEKAVVNTSLTIKETNGDIASLRMLLKDKSVDLAVVQDDILQDLIKNTPSLQKRLKIVSPLYKAYIVMVSRKGSAIDNIADLSNRKIAVDNAGSGDYYTFLNIQEQQAISPEVFNIKKGMNVKYLKYLKIDAYFFIGSLKDIRRIAKKYKVSPVRAAGYKEERVSIGGGVVLQTAYVEKYLLSTDQKEKRLSRTDLHLFLTNLLSITDKKYLCGFSEETPVSNEKYIYYVCSENIKDNSSKAVMSQKKSEVLHQRIAARQYYSNLEDIVIYTEALKTKRFNAHSTSYIIEKSKLDNAIELIKEQLQSDDETKIVIINKGDPSKIFDNVRVVKRALKKAGIPRGSLITKSIPIQCSEPDCFIDTTLQFKVF